MPDFDFQELRSYLNQPPGWVPSQVEIIDTCLPPSDDIVPWPYESSPNTLAATQIALVLRRFRDPAVTIRAILWALRMEIYSRWSRNDLNQIQLEAWNDFFNIIDNEQPLPTPAGGYQRWLLNLMGPLPVAFYGINGFLGRRVDGANPSLNPMWVFLRGYGRLLDDTYPVFDEADYYILGHGIDWLFASSNYRPLVLDSTSLLRGRLTVFRWWEILQCVMPIRDIFGPPLRLNEIRASADEEFLWDDQVIQAIAGLLEDYFEEYLADIHRRNVGDYPQAGEYWRALDEQEVMTFNGPMTQTVPVVLSIEMRAPLSIADTIPDTISIKAEMAEELASSYHFFLDREIDFRTTDTVERVATILNKAFES